MQGTALLVHKKADAVFIEDPLYDSSSAIHVVADNGNVPEAEPMVPHKAYDIGRRGFSFAIEIGCSAKEQGFVPAGKGLVGVGKYLFLQMSYSGIPLGIRAIHPLFFCQT